MYMAMRVGRVSLTPTSPLASLPSASAESENAITDALQTKGVWTGSGSLTTEWQRALATLADPNAQATVYIEGAGTARYYGGAGGIATVVPVEANQCRVLLALSIDDILTEINDLVGWRSVDDTPAFRVELSIEELTTVAALADAHREENLRACIERRAANTNRVSRTDAERQVTTGQTKPDPRWLISILNACAPSGCGPSTAALDPGAAALVARRWAKPGDGGLDIGPELELLCAGFSNVIPFMKVAVGAPWSDPVIQVFTRGPQNWWAVEYHVDAGIKPSANIARVGNRAMEESLRRHLARLAPTAAAPARDWAVPAATTVQIPPAVTAPPPVAPAQAKPQVKAPQPQPRICVSCGATIRTGKQFCTKCGTRVRDAVAP
jgi:hypothetical protein